jgi:mono/diheme cytochrome c family protein
MGRRIETSRDWQVWTRRIALAGAVLWGLAAPGIVDVRVAAAEKTAPDRRAQGRELFEREWLPGDSRTHGGDGLGPVYNDSSCIACHNLGGNGGAGPASKNVDIITASPSATMDAQAASEGGRPTFLRKALGSLVGLDVPEESDAKSPPATGTAARWIPARWSRRTPASVRRGASSCTGSGSTRAMIPGGSR